jgi:hypothetical protein
VQGTSKSFAYRRTVVCNQCQGRVRDFSARVLCAAGLQGPHRQPHIHRRQKANTQALSGACRTPLGGFQQEFIRPDDSLLGNMLIACPGTGVMTPLDFSTDILNRHSQPTFSTDILSRHSQPTFSTDTAAHRRARRGSRPAVPAGTAGSHHRWCLACLCRRLASHTRACARGSGRGVTVSERRMGSAVFRMVRSSMLVNVRQC